MRRHCFISVISTGYKLYFLSILTNVKLFAEKNTINEQTPHPGWTHVGLLSKLPDLSLFFVYLFCLFMQRHM